MFAVEYENCVLVLVVFLYILCGMHIYYGSLFIQRFRVRIDYRIRVCARIHMYAYESPWPW